jgi:flagellar basal body-associated protein FliL
MSVLSIGLVVLFVVLVVLAVGVGLGIYFLVRASNRRSQGQVAEQPPAPSGEGPGAAPRI